MALKRAVQAVRNFLTPPVSPDADPMSYIQTYVPIMRSPEEELAHYRTLFAESAREITETAENDRYLSSLYRRSLHDIFIIDKFRAPGLRTALNLPSTIGDIAIVSAYGDYVSSLQRPKDGTGDVHTSARGVLAAATRTLDMGTDEFRLPEVYFGEPVSVDPKTGFDIKELHPDMRGYGIEIIQAWVLNAALGDITEEPPRIHRSLRHVFGSFADTVYSLGITPETIGLPNGLIGARTEHNLSGELHIWASDAKQGASPETDQALAVLGKNFMAGLDPHAQDSFTL